MAGDSYDEKKSSLSPLEYQVIVNKVTERPFSNKYNKFYDEGIYHCKICDEELFKSDTKFESKSGWPAFSQVIQTDKVKLKPDSSNVGMNLLLLLSRPDLGPRTEVSCAKCGAHLGHLFKDGPKPSGGLRYCINSASLSFVPAPVGENKDSGVQSENTVATTSPCGVGKICFLSTSSNDDSKEGKGMQRISTTPRPLPTLRETTL